MSKSNKVQEFWLVRDSDGDFLEPPRESKKDALKTIITGETLFHVIEKQAYDELQSKYDELVDLTCESRMKKADLFEDYVKLQDKTDKLVGALKYVAEDCLSNPESAHPYGAKAIKTLKELGELDE